MEALGCTVKKNITSLAGVIDPDYTGNVSVVLHNFGSDSQKIQPGDKIAQLIFEKIKIPKVKKVDQLEDTERGDSVAPTFQKLTNCLLP